MHWNAQGMRASENGRTLPAARAGISGSALPTMWKAPAVVPSNPLSCASNRRAKSWSIPAQPTRVRACRPRWRRSARRRWASPWKISRSSPAIPAQSHSASGRSLAAKQSPPDHQYTSHHWKSATRHLRSLHTCSKRPRKTWRSRTAEFRYVASPICQSAWAMSPVPCRACLASRCRAAWIRGWRRRPISAHRP